MTLPRLEYLSSERMGADVGSENRTARVLVSRHGNSVYSTGLVVLVVLTVFVGEGKTEEILGELG